MTPEQHILDALERGTSRARLLLGIDPAWIIRYELVDAPGDDSGDDWRGGCTADTCSLSAFVEYRNDLELDQIVETTLHEMMHVAHADVDHYLSLILPDTMHAEYQRLYEQFVTRTTRALVQHLEGKEPRCTRIT